MDVRVLRRPDGLQEAVLEPPLQRLNCAFPTSLRACQKLAEQFGNVGLKERFKHDLVGTPKSLRNGLLSVLTRKTPVSIFPGLLLHRGKKSQSG